MVRFSATLHLRLTAYILEAAKRFAAERSGAEDVLLYVVKSIHPDSGQDHHFSGDDSSISESCAGRSRAGFR